MGKFCLEDVHFPHGYEAFIPIRQNPGIKPEGPEDGRFTPVRRERHRNPAGQLVILQRIRLGLVENNLPFGGRDFYGPIGPQGQCFPATPQKCGKSQKKAENNRKSHSFHAFHGEPRCLF
jgi:hypothetical protein